MATRAAKDTVVRATDLDALSCRHSANTKGYFLPADPHVALLVGAYESALQHCDGYTQLAAGRTLRSSFGAPKLPLINRGTYLRTAAIDLVVSLFIAEHGACQVVSLGAGSDTRGFRVLQQHPGVSYTEIDFAESTRIKKLAISRLPALRRLVGAEDLAAIDVNSRADLAAMDPHLHGANYHLVALDLRDLAARGTDALAFLDSALPTLVVCECVLCYLPPKATVDVLAFWKQSLRHVAVVVYDPMGLGDAFGAMMAQNLGRRGLDMLSFSMYPDLPARKKLFEETLGFQAHLTDSALIGGYSGSPGPWLGAQEAARVGRLEMIDEVEEIALLLRHYCLIYAEAGLLLRFAAQLPWLT
ncbi:S-adenosyl-L-methionine-dependent methyltransferase [Metschnikowia bicuspidata var. bicuspidata NRRL YB-4993]|uniref:Leucine carboxyl methyltransferase 1 n=1 Tax=Metschnikowia bicuspidata var. bicuspidata NRRL YB-4993 TaxID=869754 RepID=A0A1A0H9U0_9ASCO|nr:S-adenosyl-L-methionine-dependent methyltransferase [Metschnikowia bicuspidata var. bicuspidata NRRL YB-4993]OBA20781.1 S-adenosyl-L-methionine-dependent methyltransferase [Metschnikowia bicuspidata var. bicuspidata NRRL YB-4993]